MNVLIIHCWGGNGRSCWSGWLADQLKVLSPESRVLTPDMPNTEMPKLTEWLAEVRRLVPKFDSSWVLVGHSLGCATILRLLEQFDASEKVGKVILVAAFAKPLDGCGPVDNFVSTPFNWKKIKTKAKQFTVINSDNDPFIELSEGERVAKLLDAKLIVEHGAGHINEGAGWTKYERVLKLII